MAEPFEIRIPNVSVELTEGDRRLLIEELVLIGDQAAAIVTALRGPSPYEPTREDVAMLARALDHLRSLDVMPPAGVSELPRLRDMFVAGFRQYTYRLTPNTGEQSFDTFSFGPRHEAGDRLVDLRTHRAWRVLAAGPESTPIELDVEPWD